MLTQAPWPPVQEQWHIENKLHGVRAVTYADGRSLIRTGSTPRVMTGVRSLAIGLVRLAGHTNIVHANRHHVRDPHRTLGLLPNA